MTHEPSYIEGRNAALRRLMLHCGRELGALSEGVDPLMRVAVLEDELARARKALHEVCERLGCDDWPDDLDLGDVVNKYVLPALLENEAER